MKKALTPIAFYIREGAKRYDIAEMTGKKAIWEELKKMLKHIKNPIEIDAYIREIGKILNLSTDVLYSELKSFREKRVIDEVKKNEGFELSELIAGYMRLYGYFDLFLEKFQYTLSDGMSIPSFFVIKNILAERESQEKDGDTDMNRLTAVELFLEEENASLSKEIIVQKFLELVNRLNKLCFEQEKKQLLSDIDPNSAEYIMRHRELQEKGKSMGIKTNRG